MRSSDHSSHPGDEVEQRTLNTLRANIHERCKELGINYQTASERSGLNKSYVSQLLNASKNKNKNPSGASLEKLAKGLGTTVDALLRRRDDKDAGIPRRSPMRGATVKSMRVMGVVEGGVHRTMLAEPMRKTIEATPDRDYPDAECFAFEVRGDIADATEPTPLLHGTYALCVDMEAAGIEVADDNLYVVKRAHPSNDGSYEYNIRRAKIFKTHIEFIAESTNPHYETWIVKREDLGKTISAIGLVYAMQASTKRR
jgi:hypothetical protein